MLQNLVEYHWAEHIDDVLFLLARLDTKTVPLAGGTYLLGLQQNDDIQAVVDLRDLNLAYITEDTHNIRIGAMTSLQSIADAPLLKEYASGLLARAAFFSSSSRLIRNSATIGGTLAVGSASQADLLTALAVLDAQVLVRSGSRTEIDLGGGTAEQRGLALSGVVYKGKQERSVASTAVSMVRRPNELIVEVIVHRPRTNCGGSILRIGRTASDVALLNAAALVEVEDGVYRQVRLACGGVNMEPVRMEAVEQQLEGQPATYPMNYQRLFPALQMSMATLRSYSDTLVSSDYRRVSGVNLAYHALEEATHRCTGGT